MGYQRDQVTSGCEQTNSPVKMDYGVKKAEWWLLHHGLEQQSETESFPSCTGPCPFRAGACRQSFLA